MAPVKSDQTSLLRFYQHGVSDFVLPVISAVVSPREALEVDRNPNLTCSVTWDLGVPLSILANCVDVLFVLLDDAILRETDGCRR